MQKTYNQAPLKIGISGKRRIEEKAKLPGLIEARIREILHEHNATEFTGYTSLAIGADTVFAEVVTEVFKMPLLIVLPMPVEEYAKDFEGQDLVHYNHLLQTNSQVHIINNGIPANAEERNQFYFSAGKYMVDHCDEVVFAWDGLKPRGKGGTAEIMGYYSEKKNKVPVDHIMTTARRKDPLTNRLWKEFHQFNNEALNNRDAFRMIWKLAILLGWLAVVLFAMNMATGSDHAPSATGAWLKLTGVGVEFILVLTVFLLISRARSKDFHGNYLQKRSMAEILRVLRYFYHAGVEIKTSALTANSDSGLLPTIEEINHAVRETYNSKWYANYSIRLLIDEQIQYHTGKIKSIGHKFHLFEKLNMVVAVLFLVNLTAHLVNEILHFYHKGSLPVFTHGTTVFLSILLPATYAAIEGFLYFQEWGLLRKYSLSAKKVLEDTAAQLSFDLETTEDQICFDKQQTAMQLVASVMLTDNKNWNMVFEHKNNYHWVI